MFRALRPSASLYRSAVLAKNAAVAPRVSVAMNFARMYSAGAGLARSDVEKRVLDILAGFNKVDANKVKNRCHPCGPSTWLPSLALPGANRTKTWENMELHTQDSFNSHRHRPV